MFTVCNGEYVYFFQLYKLLNNNRGTISFNEVYTLCCRNFVFFFSPLSVQNNKSSLRNPAKQKIFFSGVFGGVNKKETNTALNTCISTYSKVTKILTHRNILKKNNTHKDDRDTD